LIKGARRALSERAQETAAKRRVELLPAANPLPEIRQRLAES